MKKLGILTLATTALLLSGCNDEFGDVNGEGTQTVTFTAALPGQVTRAYSDGEKATSLYCLLYQGNEFVESAPVKKIEGKTATVQFAVAKGVDYNLVFWASNDMSTAVVETMPADKADLTKAYTIATSTGDLKVNYSKVNPNDDTADAFYATIKFHGGDPNPDAITLTRPFAQLNIGSTDQDLDAVTSAYSNGVYSDMTFQAYTSMNMLSKVVAESSREDVTTQVALRPDPTEYSYPIEPGKTKYTGMAYMLVPQDRSALTDVTCNFYAAQGGTAITSRSIDNVPLRANYRTNIYGALLTSATDFAIEISPAFIGEVNNPEPVVKPKEVNSADGINTLFADDSYAGKTVDFVVTQDITEPIVIRDMPSATTLNIDYAGKKITGTITAGRNVIINVYNAPASNEEAKAKRRFAATRAGEVVVEATNELFVANEGATINLYSGYYKTNGAVIARANKGTVNIYGGYYWATNTMGVDNKKVVANNGGHINVLGGYFRSQFVDNGSISLAEMGITPDPACKVTKHSEADIPTTGIWYQVEKVWHPGIDIASLEWENIGVGYFKDAWMRSVYRDFDTSVDIEALADLPVTIQRCTTYPTLYKIVNPYINAPKLWFNAENQWLHEKPALCRNGEIIFDMHNTSCVTVVPNVYCGLTYYFNEDDEVRPFNVEGTTYYNYSAIDPDVANSLENIIGFKNKYYNDEKYGFNNDLTRYDKSTRTLHFRNARFDVIGAENWYNLHPYGNSNEDWMQYQRGHLIFPENFVLLDVYGNPVK